MVYQRSITTRKMRLRNELLINAKFKVKGRASNLADLDGWTTGNSDPYMEVAATDVNGYTETKKKHHTGEVLLTQGGMIAWYFQSAHGRKLQLRSWTMMALVA